MSICFIKKKIPVSFAKFCAIGIVNTCVGYSLIFFSLYILGLNYLVSNTIGYTVGLGVSFCLNKFTNFKSPDSIFNELPKFCLSFLLSYFMNNLTLILCVEFLHVSKIISIALAGGVYTVSFYFFSRYVVFTKKTNSLMN